MSSIHFLAPLTCHVCGKTTSADKTSIMSNWFYEPGGIAVRPGDLIPNVSFIDLQDGESHLALREPRDGEIIASLEKWSCQTVLPSGELCRHVGDGKDAAFARIELRPVGGGLVFVGAESVPLNLETLESVHLIDVEFGHWFENDPTGHLTEILGPLLPGGRWPDELRFW